MKDKTMQLTKDLASEHRALFQEVRALLLSVEGITEIRKERLTAYATCHGGICHLRTTDHGIDIGFLHGARMTDGLRLLSGSARAMRVLSLKEKNEPALMYYITQAMQLCRTAKVTCGD